jgi:hypothetical protein
MSKEPQHITCPVCQTPIIVDIYALLGGAAFSCPNQNCDVRISLPTEGKALAQSVLQQFEKVNKLPGH